MIWDNGPAHGGDAIREYLATPDLDLRLVRLPAYSPDYHGDEAIWKWVREEVTANTGLGTKANVQEELGAFFRGLGQRADEVQTRCRTLLQTEAAALVALYFHLGFAIAAAEQCLHDLTGDDSPHPSKGVPGLKPKTTQHRQPKGTRKQLRQFVRHRSPTPDERLVRAVEQCTDCPPLQSGWTKHRREVIEVMLAPAWVIKHQYRERQCRL